MPVREGGHAVNTASVADGSVREGTFGRQPVELGHCLEAVNGRVGLEALQSLAQGVDLLVCQRVDVLPHHVGRFAAVADHRCYIT